MKPFKTYNSAIAMLLQVVMELPPSFFRNAGISLVELATHLHNGEELPGRYLTATVHHLDKLYDCSPKRGTEIWRLMMIGELLD